MLARRTFSSKNRIMKALAATTLAISAGFVGAVTAEEAQVIELTQVNCQFVESENDVNHGFQSTQKSDCVAINKQSAEDRLAQAQSLELKPGKYIFRVTNVSVDYPLGFYLRGEGLIGKARLPKVSGGGLAKGVTKDYEIELKSGEYVYSCPLNSTPDYKLVVSES